MRLFFFLIMFFILGFKNSPAQTVDISDVNSDTTVADTESIDVYDKFNSILGGDSVRWKEKGVKLTGSYEEYYSNGKLKHKGFYTNGQLSTIYKNYFDNGQLERSFKMIDSRNFQMELYYKSGVMKSKRKYFKGKEITEEDYYPNGKMEYFEENDKSFEFYITMNYYYKNGSPQSSLQLVDKKNKMYDSKEYWPNGNVKEEGKMFFNKVLNDYLKNGTWILYDDSGKKIAEEDYVKGQVNEERKF